MHNKRFVSLTKIPLLDVASALELYQVQSLPIVNPGANICATYDLETNKFVMSKDGIRCALPSVEDHTKCIIANNYFCIMSTPQYNINTHILCVLVLFRHCGIDQYCRVKLSIHYFTGRELRTG